MSMPQATDVHSPHEECAAYLHAFFASQDIEVTVSTLGPIVPSVYEDIGMSCPHGVRFYAEPTGEQIAAWARDGVE